MNTPASTKNAWARTRDLYFGLAMPGRLAIIGAAALLGIAAIYWSIQPPKVDWVYLLGGQEFSEPQLQLFCQSLEAEGMTGFQVDGTRLRVPRASVAQSAAALAKREVLPASFYSAFDKAAEQTSWWSSSVQDDRRWELARQKSLAQIIEQMPEVETASVLIDRSTSRGLRSQSEIRGNVTVKPRSGRELPAFRLRQIRNVVAGSVANLSPENITVVDLNAKTSIELGTSGANSDDLLARMKEFEEHFTWKIRSVLSYLPDVLVTVNVELDTTRQRRTEQVILPVHGEPETSDPLAPPKDEPASVSANASVELPTRLETAQPSEHRPTQQQTWEEHVALAPKSVAVAIAVPQDVVVSLRGLQNGSNSDPNAWSDRIKDLVASAIPAGVTPKINVDSYPRTPEPVHSGSTESASTSQAGWLPWGLAAGLGVALSGILGLMGIKLHSGRIAAANYRAKHLENADRELASSASRDAAAGESRRELVRIERGAATLGRGPHLMQATFNNFEDLRHLAPSCLQAVLIAVESRLWAPALRGASRELCERILTHMPARAAMLLRHEIEYPGPVRLGDVETAQQEILEVVRRLDHTGDLILEDREEAFRE